MGDESSQVALGVGMLKVTTLWSWRLPANRARGGADARDLVLCAIGSCGGGVSSLITLGDGATACGSGVSAKVSRRGTVWIGWGDWLGDRVVKTGGKEGVLAVGGDMAGVATLGGVLSCTLGGAGAGIWA